MKARFAILEMLERRITVKGFQKVIQLSPRKVNLSKWADI